MEAYIAVLGAFAVLLLPAFFYLWLRWHVRKRLRASGRDVTRSETRDRQSDLE